LARWAAVAVLVAVCWATFGPARCAWAQEATTTTTSSSTTTTVDPSSLPVSAGQAHEIEQEMLVGMSLVVLLVAAHVVGSWRR
jgi:hypothetical protein